LKEAFTGSSANDWYAAWRVELDQLEWLKAWEIIPRPMDKPVIPYNVVLHEKHGSSGDVYK